MRKKIQELAAGKCDKECPIVQFSEEELEVRVLEGQNFCGKFTITSRNEIPMRGIVYSSNPRMECHNSQFQGTEVIINYEFHSEGMVEGDSQKGDFYIICNEGEYDLPFRVSVSKGYPESSMGRIDSIFSFANLAQKSYEEAVEVFGKLEFINIFKPREQEERLGYLGLMKIPCTMAQVEEFLILAKKKKRVTFTIEEGQTAFYGIRENEKQHVVLKKDNWGYTSIEMSSDAAFVEPVKQVITSEDFVGNRAVAEYVIVEERLHSGKNFARITFENSFQKEQIELCVMRGEEGVEREQTYLEIQKRRSSLLEYYTAFRLRQMVTGVWAKKTCEELDFLMNLQPDNQWCALYKAQVLLVNRQKQEAEWILDSFRRKNKEKDTPLYAYYLYLCTLVDPEPAYVNKLTTQIEEIYHRNQEHLILLWILLFIDEELNYSNSRKLEIIENRIEHGCDSPLLYVEAYSLFSQEPYLIHKGSKLERKIMNWAVKHNALTLKMAEQVKQLIPQMTAFHPVWYRIMEACYEKYPSNELLQEICGYCIRAGRYGKNFFKWYEAGVGEELRIGGLYEAWMLSADRAQFQKIPKLITMYFQYHSNLAYQQQAMLYRAVITNKQSMKQVFQNYQKSMEEFALEQMRAGRIDPNLAVIYREFLTPAVINQESAEWLAKVIFACQVTCKEEKAVRIIVRQHQLQQEQIIPLVNHRAYVNIYGTVHSILLEDAKGNRFLPEEELVIKPLLHTAPFLKKGMEYAENKLPYMLSYFDRKKIWQTYEEEDLPYLKQLMESEQLSREYQEEIRLQMIAYYYDNYTGETLDEFLENLSFERLEQNIRGKLMELLVARGHFHKAYELVLSYGSETLSAAKLLSVICNRIDEIQMEPDDFLVGMCRNVFLRGKYNDMVLEYMCRYFYGNLKEMTELWHAAREFEVERHELEERCLTQFLYTGSYARGMEDIFESYDRGGGRKLVIMAYLSQMSHKYLTSDIQVSDYVFQKIAEFLEEEEELNEPCRLGFLKWCSRQENLSEKQKQQSEQLLKIAISEGKYFPFYKKLPQEFAEKYMYYDKTFLEYRTVPDTRVLISYGKRDSENYVECDMTRMYSGIFVKSFTLFFEEEVPYYIKEEEHGEFVVTQSGHVQSSELCPGSEENRYHLLNDMVMSWKMKDEVTIERMLEQYQKLDKLVQEKFTVI